jgi:hypothetical protein
MPSITKPSLVLPSGQKCLMRTPEENSLKLYYREEPFRMLCILDKESVKECKGEEVVFSYQDSVSREVYNKTFPVIEALHISGNELFKMGARSKIIDLEKEKKDSEASTVAETYQVLSKETSLFGVVKSDKGVEVEMKKVEIEG